MSVNFNKIASEQNFFLIAGPCVVEGEQMAFDIAGALVGICRELDIPLIFKGSYRKANRSRLDSFTGIGDAKALDILSRVGREFGIPVITDVHECHEVDIAAEYVDALQIPAFLCRQTDLLLAAGRSDLAVNIKKGQFSSPESMRFVVEKVRSTGNDNIALTDRGTSFGYGDLIVDFRGVPSMRHEAQCPVVVDITHSLQQPNRAEGVTGGRPDMIETIARCAVAAGADGLFMETHPDPSVAKSDGANMLRLDLVKPLLERLTVLRSAVNEIGR